MSGFLKPTPVLQLPVLAGIAPAGLMLKAATLALARKAEKDDWYTLHDTTTNEVQTQVPPTLQQGGSLRRY